MNIRHFSILAALFGASLPLHAKEVSYNHDIRPILSDKCFACHGPDEKARKAELRLDQRESALQVIEPGEADKSELIARIGHLDPDEVMPPPDTHKEITAKDVEVLRAWIDSGAEYETHWAFIPPLVVEVPSGVNAIDHLIRQTLKSEGLHASPRARQVNQGTAHRQRFKRKRCNAVA